MYDYDYLQITADGLTPDYHAWAISDIPQWADEDSDWQPEEKGVTGVVSIKNGGYGFMRRDDGHGSVFIAHRHLKNILNNDKVEVSIGPGRIPGKKEGRVVQILERRTTELVGTLLDGVTEDFVASCSSGESIVSLTVPQHHSSEAHAGDLVVIELLSDIGKPFRGTVKEVLAKAGDPQKDIVVALRKQGFEESFPKSVMSEIEAVPNCVQQDDLAGRADLRSLLMFTIDGETSSDFDDAVAIEELPEGYRLIVSIADVTHYVKEGSAIESEAIRRGTSVYFPGGKSVPMLPVELSSGICSLNPSVDRLALTVDMYFNRAGELQGSLLYPSVIHSKARLTYGRVSRSLNGENSSVPFEILDSLRMMNELAGLLYEKRCLRGSIGFDSQETIVTMDEAGSPVGISRTERTVGSFIIEQFMLAANEEAGRYATEMALPFIYRVHPGLDNDKCWDLFQCAQKYGYKLPPFDLSSQDVQSLLTAVEGKAEERLITSMVLRCMQKAFYSEKDIGHFGLAGKSYTHFTSPIRRLADLFVHRVIKASFTKEDLSDYGTVIRQMASQASSREIAATEAEREVVRLQKLRFVEGMIGEIHAAVVSGVTSSGFYVELDDLYVEGLVPIDTLEEAHEFDEKKRVLVELFGESVFMVGDRVVVEVANVDYGRMRVNMKLIGKV